MTANKKINYVPTVHILVWLVFIITPILIYRESLSWFHTIRHCIYVLTMICVFYANYYYLIKKYLYAGKLKTFALINLMGISILCACNIAIHQITEPYIRTEQIDRAHEEHEEFRKRLAEQQNLSEIECAHINQSREIRRSIWGISVSIACLFFIMGTAIAIYTLTELYKSKEKIQEEERAKAEAELKNLKSQLNPHFLFNTLNNIYALIAISQEKSQEAVLQLSKMLRYVLYENDVNEVPLHKEMEFIQNYIDLMKLRLSSSTKVAINTNVPANCNVMVAPLLFINLIENAFKHGVSNQCESFIDLSIMLEEENTIHVKLENSYHPKSEEHDKSGSGIGLENMRRRLQLIYPDKHVFKTGVDGNTYKSELIIQTSNT